MDRRTKSIEKDRQCSRMSEEVCKSKVPKMNLKMRTQADKRAMRLTTPSASLL